jgi:hypothetical protein
MIRATDKWSAEKIWQILAMNAALPLLLSFFSPAVHFSMVREHKVNPECVDEGRRTKENKSFELKFRL